MRKGDATWRIGPHAAVVRSAVANCLSHSRGGREQIAFDCLQRRIKKAADATHVSTREDASERIGCSRSKGSRTPWKQALTSGAALWYDGLIRV